MNDGPLARRDGLVVKTVGDEVLVYDLERARAHSLDALAAAIWRRCDGRRPVAALAAAVRAETGVPVTAAAVEYGLAALGRARLLAGERPVPGPTRRQVLARIGTAAAIPLVLSITAPTAAQAQSPPQRPILSFCGALALLLLSGAVLLPLVSGTISTCPTEFGLHLQDACWLSLARVAG